MSTGKRKPVGFYRVYSLQEGRRRDLDQQDWPTVFRDLQDLDPTELEIDGIAYRPSVTEEGVAVLGVHHPLDPSYLSRRIPRSSDVTDLLGDDANAEEMFYSTAIAMCRVGNAFACALGDSHAKRASVLVALLTQHARLVEGAHWKVEPIMDEGKVDLFRAQGTGVTQFEGRFSTARHLLNLEQDDRGVLSFADQIAARIGGDVEVEIRVKLAAEARDRSSRKKFMDLITLDLPALVRDRRSGAKARTVLESGIEEDLNLVASRLAVEVDVAAEATEVRRFSAMLGAVATVSREWEVRITQLDQG